MRVVSLLVACTMWAAPLPAFAEEPAAAPVDDLAEARRLHEEAQAKYNTSDFEGALKSWQAAYAAVPNKDEKSSVLNVIIFNTALCYLRLYQLRGDIEYLKQSKINFEHFEERIDETYADSPEAREESRASVTTWLAEVDKLLAEAAAKPKEPEPKEPEPKKPEPEPEPPVVDKPPREPGRGLMIGGGVAIGLGILAGAGMTAALVVGKRANHIGGLDDYDYGSRKDTFDRGRAANAGAIAAGVIGIVCVATGVALLAVGAKRRNTRTAALPKIGRGIAGVLSGRPFF
ncbi:MAG TPA: hypothetical protein VG755_23955 [Nannocystaceae bacterium]|nr:hypothetical protein [Nannocystaceae bacterium]